LKRDTRTIKAALGDTPPDEAEPGKPQRWKIGTIRAALERHAVMNADYMRNSAASSTASLTKAHAKLASNKARIIEMQRREMEGELVPIDEVDRAWAAMIATARARLLAIPAKCAARVGMCKTTAEVAAILQEEVYAALNELAAKGGRPDEDGAANAGAAG